MRNPSCPGAQGPRSGVRSARPRRPSTAPAAPAAPTREGAWSVPRALRQRWWRPRASQRERPPCSTSLNSGSAPQGARGPSAPALRLLLHQGLAEKGRRGCLRSAEREEGKVRTAAATRRGAETARNVDGSTGAPREGPEGAAEGRKVASLLGPVDDAALTSPKRWDKFLLCSRPLGRIPWGPGPPPPPGGSGGREKSRGGAAAVPGHPSLCGPRQAPLGGPDTPRLLLPSLRPRRTTQSQGTEVSRF